MAPHGQRHTRLVTMKDTFEKQKQNFLNFYGVNRDLVILELQSCRQDNDEHLRFYASRFLRLAARAGTRMSEEEKAIMFMKGLKPELRQRAVSAGLRTINSFIEYCRTEELINAFDQGDEYAQSD